MKGKVLKIMFAFLIVFMNLGCDQISKNIVRDKIAYFQTIKIIDPHFTLTKVENSGAFLGLGDSLSFPLRFMLLSFIPLAALVYGFIFILTKSNINKRILTGVCFVIGGGLGNVYDRIIHGSVTDFLHIDLIILETGIFNMADLSIVIGLLIVFFSMWKTDRQTNAL